MYIALWGTDDVAFRYDSFFRALPGVVRCGALRGILQATLRSPYREAGDVDGIIDVTSTNIGCLYVFHILVLTRRLHMSPLTQLRGIDGCTKCDRD
jgi:hypothetical protein